MPTSEPDGNSQQADEDKGSAGPSNAPGIILTTSSLPAPGGCTEKQIKTTRLSIHSFIHFPNHLSWSLSQLTLGLRQHTHS